MISKAADIADRKKLVGLLALTFAAILSVIASSLVRAEEGGTGHHLPGSASSSPGCSQRSRGSPSGYLIGFTRAPRRAPGRSPAFCKMPRKPTTASDRSSARSRMAMHIAPKSRHSGRPASGPRPGHRSEPCPGFRAEDLHHHDALRIAMEAPRHSGGDRGFPAVSLRQDDRHGGSARPEADTIRTHSGGRFGFSDMVVTPVILG